MPAPSVPVEIQYAPEEDLERLDVRLIGEARRTIDVAAYVLTDRAVVSALEEAARRKVKVVLDADAGDKDAEELLAVLSTVADVRIKPAGELMHLKAYAIDGALVRLGSANFSRSGETRQDNEATVIRSANETQRFEEAFDRIRKIAG